MTEQLTRPGYPRELFTQLERKFAPTEPRSDLDIHAHPELASKRVMPQLRSLI